MCLHIPGLLRDAWIGEYQLGDHLDLHLLTHGNSFVATTPTAAAPIYAIFSGSGTKVTQGVLPRKDQSSTGWFQHNLRLLTAGWAAGVYTVLYTDVVAGVTRERLARFALVAGGDSAGMVIGAAEYQRPETSHIVYATESGLLVDGRTPRPAPNP